MDGVNHPGSDAPASEVTEAIIRLPVRPKVFHTTASEGAQT